MTTFGKQVVRFHFDLQPDWDIPEPYELIYPFANRETREVFEAFYTKFYRDAGSRFFIFGINPGRFGAGITGVPFTDPIRLETIAGIENPFLKKAELSSVFIYEAIKAIGGLKAFTNTYYITSLCPLGFLKNGKNFNYYDARDLQEAALPYIIDNVEKQMAFGANREKAFCLGMGKNHQFFEQLNDKYHWFGQIIALPHPRWVMQYRRKQLDHFIGEFKQAWPT
ncbi:MAG: DUF4918 family protein [Saprospiraceae bacterium]